MRLQNTRFSYYVFMYSPQGGIDVNENAMVSAKVWLAGDLVS